jgi:hypothetical protein
MTEADQLKARLMKDIEAEIDRMLANKPACEEITLSYTEKSAVGVGEKLKEVIAQALLEEHREKAQEVKCPSCGKRLGMKDYRSRRIVTEAGEVELRRAYYHCEGCEQGVFPPR